MNTELDNLLAWMDKCKDENKDKWVGDLTLHNDGSGYIEYSTWTSSPGQYRVVDFKSIDELRKLIKEG